ncbi:MAG: NUDIX hydrolase [Cyanobacteria bacterium SZAS TMP-1]|nr:NUDIX hydrolase [Cyanobacteria bacterium SZAS TMP-1]
MSTNTIDYLKQISDLFQSYLRLYPEDGDRLSVLSGQLQSGDTTLNDRKNMIGHLTGSALVLNEKNECLLIRHRFLQRWLQPGGHLDAGESPAAGALRELKEETNLSAVVQIYCSQADGHNCPIDIDSHAIPASAAKNEGEHLHHDFQYIFRLEADHNLALDQGEVSDFKWVPLQELAGGDYGRRLARVAAKMQALNK